MNGTGSLGVRDKAQLCEGLLTPHILGPKVSRSGQAKETWRSVGTARSGDRRRTSKMRRDAAGFTLMEILLVVVIIGMLVGVAVVKLGPTAENARKVSVRNQIDSYKTALGIYELDNGFFPSGEQGLKALLTKPGSPPTPGNWKGPYLDPAVLRQDPWQHDYTYRYPGQKVPNGFDLFSPGPNGVEGDEDDIGNWQ